MGMDTQRYGGPLPDCPNGGCYLIGQRAAVSITQHQAAGPGPGSCLQAAQGITGISLKAIEKVLGVKENGKPLRPEIAYRVGNHIQVFLKGSFQYPGNL